MLSDLLIGVGAGADIFLMALLVIIVGCLVLIAWQLLRERRGRG